MVARLRLVRKTSLSMQIKACPPYRGSSKRMGARSIYIPKIIIRPFRHKSIGIQPLKSLSSKDLPLIILSQEGSSIAIVLIDMMMPHLDTPSIILALQQINPEVQIVVMSGSYLNLAAIVDKQQVSAVLTKPFTTAEMLQTLAEI